MKIWCLFEQSGTFKNEFKKLGFKAYDVDILDDFGETDFKIDLFSEIHSETCKHYDWHDGTSFFDKISKDDLVFAFFPCTRFQTQTPLLARGESWSYKGWDELKKLENSRKIVNELNYNYERFCWLFEIALKKGFKMVVENPYSRPNFLRDYFPIKPAVIIKNRAELGDLYRKPTQFWFVNFKPKNEFVLRNDGDVKLSINKVKGENGVNRKTRRSLISPEFASRFIREFILEPEQP